MSCYGAGTRAGGVDFKEGRMAIESTCTARCTIRWPAAAATTRRRDICFLLLPGVWHPALATGLPVWYASTCWHRLLSWRPTKRRRGGLWNVRRLLAEAWLGVLGRTGGCLETCRRIRRVNEDRCAIRCREGPPLRASIATPRIAAGIRFGARDRNGMRVCSKREGRRPGSICTAEQYLVVCTPCPGRRPAQPT